MAYTWTERTALGSLPWSATSARDTRMAAAVSYGGAGPEALLISQEVVNLENLGPYLVSGQSFTLSSGATISRISFNAAVATETTITANVRLLVGGAPSSIVATTSVIVAPGAFAWLDAVFTPQAVVAGEYLFEITAANNVYCMGAYGDPYAGGSFFYNGQPNPDRDMAFRVYTLASVGGNLWLSTDNGATWSENTVNGLHWWYGVALGGTTKIAACSYNIGSSYDGSGGYIYTSTNNGLTWTERTAAGKRKWRSIASSSEGTILYAADEGDISVSSNSVSPNSVNTNNMFLDWNAWQTFVAVGSGLTKFSSTAFSRSNSGVTGVLRGYLYAVNQSTGLPIATLYPNSPLATSTNTVPIETLETKSSVKQYTPVTFNFSGETLVPGTRYCVLVKVVSISGGWIAPYVNNTNPLPNEKAGIVCGEIGETSGIDINMSVGQKLNDGAVYKSTDSGATWTTLTNAGTNSWKTISCSATGTKVTVYASEMPNGCKYSTDSGATWTDITASVSDAIALVVSGDGNSLYVTTNDSGGPGYVKKSTNNASTWTSLTSSGNLLWKTIAVSDDGGEIIATYEDGSDSYNTKVKTSIDGGTTWVAHTSFTVHAPQVPCPVAISGNGSNIVFGSVGYPFMSGRDAVLDTAPIPTEVTGTVTVPNTGGTITLTEDMSVTATGDLTLDVAEVGNLAGGKVITVQPGGKIKLTAGQQITVQAETLYELQT